MAEHIDREKSLSAIDDLIKEERNKVRELEARKREREKQGLPTDHLDREIENENQAITGKETVRGIVDGYGQDDAIQQELKAEETLLEDGKKALEQLRRASPKDQRAIDELDRNVERLKHRIAGKEKAQGAVVH